MPQVTVVIADDHAIVRKGLNQLISETPGMSVVGETGNGSEVVELVRKLKPQVLVMDISMPGRTGLEVLKELRQTRPAPAVLILSIHPEEQFAVRALRAGASGYITKESASEELIGAIQRICTGRKYISQNIAERLASLVSDEKEIARHELLSDREFQVFRLLAMGKTVGEIGAELALSVKTISTYRFRVLEKMNLKTNAELNQYALLNKLIG